MAAVPTPPPSRAWSGEHVGDLVEEIAIGSPADRAGIHSGTSQVVIHDVPYRSGGDVIVSVAGVQLTPELHVGDVVSKRKPGDVVAIRLWRDDKLITVRVKLAKAP